MHYIRQIACFVLLCFVLFCFVLIVSGSGERIKIPHLTARVFTAGPKYFFLFFFEKQQLASTCAEIVKSVPTVMNQFPIPLTCSRLSLSSKARNVSSL